MKFNYLFVLLLLLSLTSCSSYYYPNLLMTNLNEKDLKDINELQVPPAQTIKKGDQFIISVYPNKGEQLVISSNINSAISGGSANNYYVNENGHIDLPILGDLYVEGMLIEKFKDTLTKLYSQYISDPYVFLSWTNKKVYVFSQGSGSGTSIPFSNSYITLLDAIIGSGGIGEAYSNKIIIARPSNNEQNFSFYRVNLQDKENLYLGNVYLKDGDMVYIIPKQRVVYQAITEISPYLSFLNTILIVMQLFVK
ncbi:MAG TPA: polysaccharide biosynthesis/export family protein [Bacteroidales bacterium]|nr:polysaccharide biosynthesis/export family protein [Bacteroidales bacterium]MBP8946232.1 polysaccharide biosynthesis/export family protein [Bacteroidales bacterium]HOL74495.1 polysaccharide biosynthesis/export family protein [Bacteroidales bacterium]HON97236.1 polysaccharide biosynthesis/export family protein [Bacteroidales bacterium]HPM39496.1 polysaccharide biosynthesis/export family protein [Bacteroidales bacterium]